MIKPDRWQPADGLRLEPNALIAAREDLRNLVLTAGPGAGKTEMLAQRADYLLRTGACRYPHRILAISFKVDASRNLKDRVRKRCGHELATRLDSHTFHAFAKRLIDRFRPVLVGKDALDVDYTIGSPRVQQRQIEYEDMVPLAVQILQSSKIARNALRQTYSHVFLDEFQDCTMAQYQLIKAAFLDADVLLTAVGDTKQSIMRWAGALEGVFQVFAKDFSATPLNLYQNFRSQLRLRRMQNAMVKVMDFKAAVPDVDLAGGGGLVDILEFEDSQQEAEALAEMIQEWIDEEGLAPSEIAVLVSKQIGLHADRLIAELAMRGIPFRNEDALQDLSAEPAARVIIDFLSVVTGEREPDAYDRLMNVLLVMGLAEEKAYELRARWLRFIDDARDRVRQGSAKASNADALHKLGEEFIELLGREALAGLSADYEHANRLDEIIAQTFNRIRELLELDKDAAGALARFSEDRAVRIMTIHKCKGLEFDTVIVLGVEEQTFWSKPDDERSAYFVAISRAKRRLYLTVAARRQKPKGANHHWREARFPHEEFLGYATSTT
jgi:superfamily I DNA/RNA helicase